MRSPRSVKRPHTNHHTTNVRRNRGKQVKNSRMRQKQWAHTLIYSPDVAEKRLTFFPTSAPLIKEISEEERIRRAEKKKEKKLISKQNDDEIRRLEQERKEKEREERRLKREEERKRQEELEYQKWLEEQKKKEEELQKAEEARKAAEKKAAEAKKKEVQAEAKKEKKKEKKQTETDKTPINTTTVKVEKATPTDAPAVPASKPVEETEKKKKKKEKEASAEKEASVKSSVQKEAAVKSSVEKEIPPKSSVEKEVSPKSSAQKEASVKSSVQKEAPVKSSVEKEVPVKSSVQKEAPVKSSVEKEVPVKSSVQKEAPVKSSVEKEVHGKSSVQKEAPVKSSVEKEVPPKSSVQKETPVKSSVEKEVHVKSSVEKEVPVKKVDTPITEAAPPVKEVPAEVHEEEKHTKKKGGKGKKTGDGESGFHNGHNEPLPTNEVHIDEGHGKHEARGKKGKKGKKSETESVDVANGHMVSSSVDEAVHVIDSAPVADIPNGGIVQLDGEKKKGGKGKKNETMSLESSLVSQTTDVVLEKKSSNEIIHSETNGHEEKKEKHEYHTVEKSPARKNKQSEKKASVKYPSPEIEVKADVTVITEKIKSEGDSANDELDNVSPPIQVHEVTSTAHENGTKETVHTITTTFQTTSSTSPTQFAQNVERLVTQTLKKSKHDIVDIDQNVKMTIDAQLAKLSERKPETSTEHKIHITPLPIELHYSRPTTPSNRERVYKLLPRDIIFCSNLIDAHGEDYAGMAADPKNIYKENARSIQRKVRIFKESPHYQTYLRAKEEGRTVEEILAEEGQT